MVKNRPQCRRFWFDPWVGKIPWRWEWHPTPVSLPREFHGQRSLASTVYGVTKSSTWQSNWTCMQRRCVKMPYLLHSTVYVSIRKWHLCSHVIDWCPSTPICTFLSLGKSTKNHGQINKKSTQRHSDLKHFQSLGPECEIPHALILKHGTWGNRAKAGFGG